MAGIKNLQENLPSFFLFFFVAFTIYAATLYQQHRQAEKAQGAWLILFFAILFRATFLPTTPTLSTDIYRYVWDGRMQQAGINPYLEPPSSGALKIYRDDVIWPRINHKNVPTVYPPFAQWIFYAGCSSIGKMKAIILFFDVAALFALLALLKALGRPPGWVMVYAWNPLAVVEFSGSGHLDSLGIFWLVLALAYASRERWKWASFFFGLCLLSKLTGALILPYLVMRRRWKEAGIFLGAALLGFLPYLGTPSALFRGLGAYGKSWVFNPGFYQIFQIFFEDKRYAHFGIGILFSVILLLLAWRNWPVQRFFFWALAAALLFAPTVHPWYVIWILPFLCISPNPAWIYFSGAVVLSYAIYWVGPTGWIMAFEYLPLYGLLFW